MQRGRAGGRGSWIAHVNVYLSVCHLLRMLRKLVVAVDLSMISSADGMISKTNQASDASCSDPALVQFDTLHHLVSP